MSGRSSSPRMMSDCTKTDGSSQAIQEKNDTPNPNALAITKNDIPEEPSTITPSQQEEIKGLILDYYNALNDKCFEHAFSLLEYSETDSIENFITRWEKVAYVKVESITPYLITPQGILDYEEGKTTSHFQIVVEVKDNALNSSINGKFTYFPSVRQSPDGKWLIYGFGTSP